MLERTERFAPAPRVVIDGIDTGLWSLSYTETYDAAVLSGVPLAIEAGLRMSFLRALSVPLGNAAITATIRRLRNRPIRPAAFILQVMGVATGVGIRFYNGYRLNIIRARHHEEMEAAEQSAWLAGQNDIAMGADSIIDLLCRTTPLFMEGKPDSTGHLLRDWKARLAVTTTSHAAYLQTTLLIWQKRQNQQPDLSATVLVDVSEGDGTIVLTAAQADSLISALNSLNLRGRVHVSVVDQLSSRLPGKPLHLLVNDRQLTIEMDQSERLTPFDPGPAMFLVNSWWFLTCARSSGPNVPLVRILPQVLLSIPAAWWAHGRINKAGNQSHSEILAVLAGLSGLHCVLATPSMRNPISPEGIRRYPSLDGLLSFVMLAPVYVGGLSRRQRQLLASALGLVMILGIALTPPPRKPLHWLLEAVWPLSALIATTGIGRAMEEDAADLQAELDRSTESGVLSSYELGRKSVLELVTEGRAAAWDHLRKASAIPDDLRTIAIERLREIDVRLEALA